MMRVSKRQRIAEAAIAVVSALVMALLPSTHQSERRQKLTEDLSAYALPDGTLPIICSTDHPNSNAPSALSQDCATCLLVGTPALVVSAGRMWIPLLPPLELERLPIFPSVDEPLLNPAAAPRAPPVIPT